MMLRPGAALVIAVAIGGYLLYNYVFPTTTYIYRMTVDVRVDGQTKSGSGVIRVDKIATPEWLPGGGSTSDRVYGEGIFVDFGSRGFVVATLLARRGGVGPGNAHNWPNWDRVTRKPFPVPLARRALRPDEMPLFVTFGDKNDPSTLVRVPEDRFETIFGAGVRLEAVYVETAAEPVTRNIARHLPWLKTWPSTRIIAPATRVPELNSGIDGYAFTSNGV